MLKQISLLLVVTITVIATGCEDGKRKYIRESVETWNKLCPYVVSPYESIISMEMNHDTVVYRLLATEELAPLKNIKKNLEQHRKYMLMTISQQGYGSDNDFLNKLENAGLWFKTIYIGQQSKESVSLLYSPEELRDAMNNPMSKREIDDTLINMCIDNMKSDMPKEIEKGITLVDMKKDASSVSLIYKMDERYYDISQVKANEKDLKDGMIGSMVSDKSLVKAIVNTKRELKYVWVGNTSGRSATLCFSRAELNDIIE